MAIHVLHLSGRNLMLKRVAVLEQGFHLPMLSSQPMPKGLQGEVEEWPAWVLRMGLLFMGS